MSTFCSISFSTSRTLVPKLAIRPLLSFLYPTELTQSLHCGMGRSFTSRSPIHPASTASDGVEAWFYNCLARASNCHKERRSKSTRPTVLPTNRKANLPQFRGFTHCARSRRQQSAVDVAEPEEQPNRTKEELMALVDQYSGNSYTDQLPLLELPRLYQPSDGPHLTVSDKPEDEWPPPHYAWPADPETKRQIQELHKQLHYRETDPDIIYQMYRKLPSPRVPYLESNTRHKLLRFLSVVEKKDERSMIRYFSVIDDMKVTAIPLSVKEWTSAISFAARYVGNSTELEVEAALHMWKEMERVAGVEGNEATFNVLYDVACKAGKFTLAEMIYNEMIVRGFEFNRYHHVSKIYFGGLKRDGDAVRAAYKELVDNGEMVDTVVLNAMISALIRSYEPHTAENMYERMAKRYMEDKGIKAPFIKNSRIARKHTKLMMHFANVIKAEPSQKEKLQNTVHLSPDVHTYRILINYFAVEAGELDKAVKYLDEMRNLQIPPHGALYLALFQGFARHGGVRYTQWTAKRLENIFAAFMQAVDGADDVFITRWTVIWALDAFAKCSGRARTLEAWEELKNKWEPQEEELDHVMKVLREIRQRLAMANANFDIDWINRPL